MAFNQLQNSVKKRRRLADHVASGNGSVEYRASTCHGFAVAARLVPRSHAAVTAVTAAVYVNAAGRV
ncbi:hypothetical protein BUALT_Bualt16G0041800 [Buddleja alternifolia]|uniref:Uncharacterized protein n=1 Tax=Buddleja alternifolia TaxID=168488 RepID=A0AAV6WGQ9_9LAMI|nr:hypothetical protein BUALT_Bualt16G0041800 [Buddleja alternifolia]